MRLDEIIARDGTTCLWCGRSLWRGDLTAEHLLPRRRGGHTRPENLAVACRTCNRRRGTQPVIAHLRARRGRGEPTRAELIVRALERLAASTDPRHAEYGTRQLRLLGRLTDDQPSSPVASSGTSTA